MGEKKNLTAENTEKKEIGLKIPPQRPLRLRG